ncbi:helix-turn-helix transcriptional regulator [Albibacterium bauzanense]|uniref:Helix-turn-helix protein n=1 Tax=Albibacterium bauzanense TaxID=653929 RepID=A0A4R1LUY5_9SPHI|nr:helix-turn-helix domain-containing protein [Albibacterium bauzanense]TCK82895.1 helix-turn-helix protein [Albibacterium bauzanense]
MAQILTSYSDAEFKEILSEQVKEVFNDVIKNNKSSFQKPESPTAERYKTREETRRYFNVSLTTLYYWEKAGILIPDRIGRRVLYSEKAIQESVQKQKGDLI